LSSAGVRWTRPLKNRANPKEITTQTASIRKISSYVATRASVVAAGVVAPAERHLLAAFVGD
jgi:hypothetical protein